MSETRAPAGGPGPDPATTRTQHPGQLRDTPGDVRYVFAHPQPPPGALTGENLNADHVSEKKRVMFLDARTGNNGRGLESWDLDTHGFTMLTPPPAPEAGFSYRPSAEQEAYGPKLVEMAKRLTGAKRGYFYHAEGQPNLVVRGPDKGDFDVYVRFAHSDYGPLSPPTLRQELQDRFRVPEDEARTCGICMLNVWHPRVNPAFLNPLCLLDATSMPEYRPVPMNIPTLNSLFERNFSTPYKQFLSGDGTGELPPTLICGPTYSPEHRWVFCSDQRPDEVWFFKQYDSRPNVAPCSFHCSFQDPFHASDPATPARRSVEIRILLTFPKQQSQAHPSKL